AASQKTVCLSNLKQIQLAWLMYAGDADDKSCVSYYYSPDYSIETAWDFRIDWTDENQPTATLGLLGPYTKNGQIHSCPIFHPRQPWGRPYPGFAYNTTSLGGDVLANYPVATLTAIARPAEIVVFSDAGFGNPVNPQNYLRAPSDPFFGIGKVHFRHDG